MVSSGTSICSRALLAAIPAVILLGGVAFLVVGMGHGWDAPLYFALVGILLFPVAFFRLFISGETIDWRVEITSTLWLVIVASIPAAAFTVWLNGVDILAFIAVGLLTATFAIYAVVRFLLKDSRLGAIWGDLLLLGIGIFSDILLYQNAMGEQIFGFRGDIFEYLWMVLWASWQGVILAALVRNLASDKSDSGVRKGNAKH